MSLMQAPPSTASFNKKQLHHEIGQMIMVGFHGTEVTDPGVQKTLNLAHEGKIGGVIFFAYNIKNPQQVRALTKAFHAAQPGILIGIDQEGGKVQRLSSNNGFKDFPSPYKIATTLTTIQAQKVYAEMAKMIKEAGFNINFAPSIDFHADPFGKECPVIGKLERSFSSNSDKIVDYASAFIKAHRQVGVLTSIKHFPGHGYASQDSHKGMVDITQTSSSSEQEVFYRLIELNDVDTIMCGHLIHRGWDSYYPVTLSPLIIKKYLREHAHYNGVIITDDLHMGAIGQHYALEEVVLQAILAGNDVLLFSNNKAAAQGVENFQSSTSLAEQITEVILKALQDQRLSPLRIKESFLRIKGLKQRLLLADQNE